MLSLWKIIFLLLDVIFLNTSVDECLITYHVPIMATVLLNTLSRIPSLCYHLDCQCVTVYWYWWSVDSCTNRHYDYPGTLLGRNSLPALSTVGVSVFTLWLVWKFEILENSFSPDENHKCTHFCSDFIICEMQKKMKFDKFRDYASQ